ncbi:hypothetical protein D3C75_943690 [compost metagenome]
MLEADSALYGTGSCKGCCRILLLFLFVQNLEDPLRRSNRGLQHVGNIGRLHDRLGELAHIGDKRLHITDVHPVAGYEQTAHHTDQHITDIIDEVQHRHDDTGNEVGLITCTVQLVIDFFELLG